MIAAPTNLAVEQRAATWIEVSWANVPASAGYALYRDDAFIGYVHPNRVTYTFTGLTPNTDYRLAVQTAHTDPNLRSTHATLTASTNSDNQPVGNTGFLPQPDGVTTETTSTTITVRWDASASGHSHGLLLDSESAWVPAAETEWTFANLDPGTTYELKVRAMGAEVGDVSEWLIQPVSTTP